jgi:hypothetical protein
MTAAVALAGLAGDGCSDKAMPGTPLGTFNVTASVSTNTCGAGPNAPNPWTFQVDLSVDGSVLYWSWKDGSPYLSGVISSGVASFTDSQTGSDPADAAACTAANNGGDYWFGPSQTAASCTSSVGCTMTRSDAYEVTLASTQKSFTGTLSYTFSVVSGSNCSSQLSAAGGIYDVLPCTIAYSLSASQ